MRDHHPKDWQRAQAFERAIQARDKEEAGVYLHRQMVPLGEAEIDTEALDMFEECDSGFCFV